MDAEALIAAARAWIAGDPDPETRQELERLIEAGDLEALADRMAGPLEFGTAGIRGEVGAGPNRMNRAVIIRTTRGLADYLIADRGEAAGPVVVGYDARLSSRAFMEDTVAVLAAAGIPVRFFDEPVPTPLVAYTARLARAHAAVVITASHNPPQDNGYKVYGSNAVQIVPPVDREIAAAIARVGPANEVPRDDTAIEGNGIAVKVSLDIFDRYLEDLAETAPTCDAGRDFDVVYTPLHGVGGRFVMAALAEFGFRRVHPVPEQFEPDGRFPTVAFPNPEEPGALDLAIAHAGRQGAELILANDPDTDRLAAAIPRRGEVWRPLTGNQIGVLLADFVLSRTEADRPIVINSIVSSPMLGPIAKAYGARWEQTLTGFKWIWTAGLDLQAAGAGTFVYGYEEALGYSVGPLVRDKDGISAAVAFAEMYAEARDGGLVARLEDLYRRHGLWVSTQLAIKRPGTEGRAEIEAAMERLEHSHPESLGGERVTNVEDFRVGAEDRPRWLPATDLVVLHVGDTARVLVRPSGTEPKLKIYVDLRGHLAPGEALDDVEPELRDRADRIAGEVGVFLGLV